MYKFMKEPELVAKFGQSVQIPTFDEFVMHFAQREFPSIHLSMEDFSAENSPRVREVLWKLYNHGYNKELVRRHVAVLQLMVKAAGILKDEGVK